MSNHNRDKRDALDFLDALIGQLSAAETADFPPFPPAQPQVEKDNQLIPNQFSTLSTVSTRKQTALSFSRSDVNETAPNETENLTQTVNAPKYISLLEKVEKVEKTCNDAGLGVSTRVTASGKRGKNSRAQKAPLESQADIDSGIPITDCAELEAQYPTEHDGIVFSSSRPPPKSPAKLSSVCCADCRNFQPDILGDGSGIGQCGAGRQPRHPETPLYPRAPRRCGEFQVLGARS